MVWEEEWNLINSAGACWRLGDLERLFDKFTEEELAAMKDLCFPSKQVFDPLLITRIIPLFIIIFFNDCCYLTREGIIEFRTDLNELKPAEIRVLENAGYPLQCFIIYLLNIFLICCHI